MVVTTYVVVLPTVSGVDDIPDQAARCVFTPTLADAQALVAEVSGATYHSFDVSDAL